MVIRNGEPFVSSLPEHLQAMAAHFASVSGVSCYPVDAEGKPFATSSPSPPGEVATSSDIATASHNPGCLFCRSATLRKLANVADCPALHRYGIFQAERFGGSFVYFCPAKLVHWASPVLVGGRIAGALIAGSVLMIEPDDYLSEEVRVPLSLTAGEAAELRAQFRQIPYVPPSRVSSLARILGDMAFSLSQKLSIDSSWTSNLEGQQARISEYIHQLKSDTSAGKQQTYPLAKEKALLSLIAQGDHENASRLLSELLAAILFICGQDMALIRARCVELVVLMSRAAVDGGAAVEVALDLNGVFLAQIRKLASFEELAARLANMLKSFTDCVASEKWAKHADQMQKAVHYLNANYSHNINLQTVAAHLHMSASHFSKVFKEETGQGFVHYLNQIRVERSKDLLRDRSLSLAEIAEIVGFEDQSYFTKVFHRHAGVSPGRFRRNRGQPPEANLEVHE